MTITPERAARDAIIAACGKAKDAAEAACTNAKRAASSADAGAYDDDDDVVHAAARVAYDAAYAAFIAKGA